MRKYICALLAALLACLPLVALAEAPVDQSVIDSFTDTWVCEAKEGYAAEIWYEDGRFQCRGTRFIDVNDGYSFEFERCAYDAQFRALVCEGGVLRHDTSNEAGDRTSEEVARGFGATLTLDEKRHLHWTGSGDAIPDQVFASLDEVGEESWYDTHDEGNDAGDAFTGVWMCERATIHIDKGEGVYNVHITWGASAFETAVWDYVCVLDPSTGALTGVGKQSTETYDENGKLVSTETVYTDGAAIFTLDGKALLWNDTKEDTAQGMRFERAEG